MTRSSVIAAALLFVVIAAVGVGLGLYKYRALHPEGPAAMWEPSEAVQVVAAREVEWFPTADLVGTVFSLRSVRVNNELAGTIREVSFESGGIVEQGQALLTLDDTTDRADLALAEAGVRVAVANVADGAAQLKLAETELRRLQGIASAQAGVTEIELDRAKAELDRATATGARLAAEVDQAKARVAQVEARLKKLVLRAPFRGRAGLRLVHEGQYLSEGTDVVLLEEVSDKIYLDFAIPQEYVSRVRRGVVVMGQSPVLGDAPVRIEVVALDATVNGDTRNVRVRAIVDNTNDALRAGMFVQLRVPVEEPRLRLMIPTTAVRRTSYADQVFVVVAGAAPGELRAKQRFVKLGPTVGDDVIVLDGLAAGEELAATGSFKLREGVLIMRVEPAPEPSSPPPSPPAAGG